MPDTSRGLLGALIAATFGALLLAVVLQWVGVPVHDGAKLAAGIEAALVYLDEDEEMQPQPVCYCTIIAPMTTPIPVCVPYDPGMSAAEYRERVVEWMAAFPPAKDQSCLQGSGGTGG